VWVFGDQDGARGGWRWASAVGVVIDEGFGWLVGGADVGVAKGGVGEKVDVDVIM
jgi:hypothetical protein